MDGLAQVNGLQWLDRQLWGNSFLAYLTGAVIFSVLWFGLSFVRSTALGILTRRMASHPRQSLRMAISLLGRIHPFVLFTIAIYVATRPLTLGAVVASAMTGLITVVVILQMIRLGAQAVSSTVEGLSFGREQNDPSITNARRNISILLKAFVWLAGILFLLDNLGINVSTFITGLGIGGIAIALAAQAILGDTFSSFTIALDKPFQPGDLINVGELTGTVEYIGLKTTRIRSISGELLILSNSDLTASRVRNYTRLESQRINVKLGVTYETPVHLLKRIPEFIETAVSLAPMTRFDRATFAQFGDSALIFDVYYYAASGDLTQNAKIQHQVNLNIMESFEKENIAFAYPTQTIHLKNSATS